MTTPAAPPALETEADAPGEFDRLRRFILYHLGGFTLGLVRVNDPRQRDGVIASLAEALAREGARLVRVDLANRHPARLREALSSEPAVRSALEKPETSARAALAVAGLEHLIEAEADSTGRPPFAVALNVEREALRDAFPVPLILFLTDYAMDRLDLAAPDFFDWYSGIFRLQAPGASQPGAAFPLEFPVKFGPKAEAAPLSPGTLAERLDLLEERRAELAKAGLEAKPRLGEVLLEIGGLYADLREFHNRQMAISFLKQAAEIFHEAGRKA